MSESYPIPRTVIADLIRVEQGLYQAVTEHDSMLSEISIDTLKAGGKRLRPALVLMSGMVGNYDAQQLNPAAIASELIHTASLIHDDILDDAITRRGVPTISSVEGEHIAIAAGDFLFARAFEILAQFDMRAVKVMIEAAIDLSLGELDQIITAYKPDQSFSDYEQKARRKTAALFSACCRTGSLLSGAAEAEVEALSAYGDNLGIAFQIYDDVLDIIGGQATGKALGVDVRDGTVTVPILYALEFYGRESKLAEIVSSKDPADSDIELALEMVRDCGAVMKAKETARAYADNALQLLKALNNKDAVAAFAGIGEFVIDRYH